MERRPPLAVVGEHTAAGAQRQRTRRAGAEERPRPAAAYVRDIQVDRPRRPCSEQAPLVAGQLVDQRASLVVLGTSWE